MPHVKVKNRVIDFRRSYTREVMSKMLAKHRPVVKPHIVPLRKNPKLRITPHAEVLGAFGFKEITQPGFKRSAIHQVKIITHGYNPVKLSKADETSLLRTLHGGKFYVTGIPSVKRHRESGKQVPAEYDFLLYKEGKGEPFRVFVGAQRTGLPGKLLENKTIANFVEGIHPAIVNPTVLERCLTTGEFFGIVSRKLPNFRGPAFEVVPLESPGLKLKK